MPAKKNVDSTFINNNFKISVKEILPYISVSAFVNLNKNLV